MARDIWPSGPGSTGASPTNGFFSASVSCSSNNVPTSPASFGLRAPATKAPLEFATTAEIVPEFRCANALVAIIAHIKKPPANLQRVASRGARTDILIVINRLRLFFSTFIRGVPLNERRAFSLFQSKRAESLLLRRCLSPFGGVWEGFGGV